MTKTKTKAVFNRRFAQDLCKQGFKVIDVQPNNDKPWLNVYYFEQTPGLLQAFDYIIMNRARN